MTPSNTTAEIAVSYSRAAAPEGKSRIDEVRDTAIKGQFGTEDLAVAQSQEFVNQGFDYQLDDFGKLDEVVARFKRLDTVLECAVDRVKGARYTLKLTVGTHGECVNG